MALGDIIYRGASLWLRLVGNTTTTKKFLRQTGTGSVSAAPAWDTVALDDLSDVVITAPATDDVLTYDGAQWVNATVPTGSPGPSGEMTIVGKAADETVNNSTAFQDDDELFFTVAANEVWHVDAVLLIDATSATPDFKCQWTVPSGATYYIAPWFFSWNGVLTTGSIGVLLSTFTATGTAVGTVGTVVKSVIVVGGTGGTVTLQWAQSSLHASNLKLLRGSALFCYRVL